VFTSTAPFMNNLMRKKRVGRERGGGGAGLE
jgi:hypothetical protein